MPPERVRREMVKKTKEAKQKLSEYGTAGGHKAAENERIRKEAKQKQEAQEDAVWDEFGSQKNKKKSPEGDTTFS